MDFKGRAELNYETEKEELTMKNKPLTAKNQSQTGTLDMLAAAVLFATGGIVLKFIPWNPLAINGIRSLFGFLVLGGFFLITRRKLVINKTVLIGAAAYAAMTTLYVAANKMTTAANAIVLQFTAPVWIILFSWLLFRKRPSRLESITLLLVFFGICCFFFDGLSSSGMTGNLLALASGACYALMFMQNSLKEGNAMSSVLIGQLISFFAAGGFVFSEIDFSLPALLAILWLGAVQVGLAYIFFCLGTGLIDPLRASLITAVEPVLNPLLVALFWHESIPPAALAGCVIVIVSVAGYSWLCALQENRGTAQSPELQI